MRGRRNEKIFKLDLAVKSSAVKTKGTCCTSVEFRGQSYENVEFSILDDLLWDVILGCEFLSQHESVKIDFGGPKSTLKLGALKSIQGIKPVRLFEHLSTNYRPIATKRRNYSKADENIVNVEISKLLSDVIIEPSSSPWRAQVVVTKNSNHKNACAYTFLDAYPLPTMQCH